MIRLVAAAAATNALPGTTSGFPVEAPAAGTTIAAATPVVILSVMITVAAPLPELSLLLAHHERLRLAASASAGSAGRRNLFNEV